MNEMNLPQEQPTLKSGLWMGRLACNKRRGQYTGQVVDCHVWRKDELSNDWHRVHEKESWIMRNDQLLTRISMWSFQEQLQAENLEGMSIGVILMTGKANCYGAGPPQSPKGTVFFALSLSCYQLSGDFLTQLPSFPSTGKRLPRE